MFLRSKRRWKDGKEHRYFSVVENRRVPSGRVMQRQVLFLGEINDRQEAAWRKTLEVFDEAEQRVLLHRLGLTLPAQPSPRIKGQEACLIAPPRWEM